MADEQTLGATDLTIDLAIAWLRNPHTRASANDVSAFLSTLHARLSSLADGGGEEAQAVQPAAYKPAVTARRSLANPAFIISMIDGKPYRTLKRHLSTNGLTPAEYRQRYGLKADYPMVAPSYSEARSATAKKSGLGRKKQEAAPAETAEPAPKPRRRRSAAEAKAAAREHLKS